MQQGGGFFPVHAETDRIAPGNVGLEGQHIEVHLRAFKTPVAQQLLQRQRLDTAVKQVHRVAVAERVRGDGDREPYPLLFTARDGVTQPVADRVVRDLPDAPGPESTERVQVIAQPPREPVIKQRHVAVTVLRRPAGFALLLEGHQGDERARRPALPGVDVARRQRQGFAQPRAGVPQHIKDHPLAQIGKAVGEQDGDFRLQQVFRFPGLTGRPLADGERQRKINPGGGDAVNGSRQNRTQRGGVSAQCFNLRTAA